MSVMHASSVSSDSAGMVQCIVVNSLRSHSEADVVPRFSRVVAAIVGVVKSSASSSEAVIFTTLETYITVVVAITVTITFLYAMASTISSIAPGVGGSSQADKG